MLSLYRNWYSHLKLFYMALKVYPSNLQTAILDVRNISLVTAIISEFLTFAISAKLCGQRQPRCLRCNLWIFER